MPYIVGYTYNADVYCVRCASRAHGMTAIEARLEGRAGYDVRDGYDANGIAATALDTYGELVAPIHSTDGAPDYDETCGTCSLIVRTGRLCRDCDHPTLECTCNMCSCGDGCDAGDCPACDGEPDDECGDCGSRWHETGDCTDDGDDMPEDDYYQQDGCSCVDCVAASEYRGEVA